MSLNTLPPELKLALLETTAKFAWRNILPANRLPVLALASVSKDFYAIYKEYHCFLIRQVLQLHTNFGCERKWALAMLLAARDFERDVFSCGRIGDEAQRSPGENAMRIVRILKDISNGFYPQQESLQQISYDFRATKYIDDRVHDIAWDWLFNDILFRYGFDIMNLFAGTIAHESYHFLLTRFLNDDWNDIRTKKFLEVDDAFFQISGVEVDVRGGIDYQMFGLGTTWERKLAEMISYFLETSGTDSDRERSTLDSEESTSLAVLKQLPSKYIPYLFCGGSRTSMLSFREKSLSYAPPKRTLLVPQDWSDTVIPL